MMNRRKCCAKSNATMGCFFVAVGFGLFLAYVIPRYIMIMLLGIGLIGCGVCIMIKK